MSIRKSISISTKSHNRASNRQLHTDPPIVPLSGGEEVLLDVGGQDATEAFEDVGHSDEAREILDGLLVGNLKRQVKYNSCLAFLKSTPSMHPTI